MQLVLHTGAHFTEEERLMKCLLRNKGDFSQRGIAVPGPGRYRRMMREMLNALGDAEPEPQSREVLLDSIVDDDNADRVILSHAHLFGVPRASVRNGVLYPRAVERLQQLVRIFPDDDLELFMAIRNPASFLPAVFGKSPEADMIGFLDGVDPRDVLWSDLFSRIRDALPQVSITLWCNEDSPLIWGQIIRELAGLEHGAKVIGSFDLLSEIMSRDGMRRFRAYLKSHPVMNEMQKRRVMAAFLDKFALEGEIEEELDLPGWTEELVEDMTEIYDEDVLTLQRIPDLVLISP